MNVQFINLYHFIKIKRRRLFYVYDRKALWNNPRTFLSIVDTRGYLTACFNSFPALKEATFEAGICIVSPV